MKLRRRKGPEPSVYIVLLVTGLSHVQAGAGSGRAGVIHDEITSHLREQFFDVRAYPGDVWVVALYDSSKEEAFFSADLVRSWINEIPALSMSFGIGTTLYAADVARRDSVAYLSRARDEQIARIRFWEG